MKYNLKKSKNELREYLIFKNKHSIVKSEKGKGSYKRKEKYCKTYE